MEKLLNQPHLLNDSRRLLLQGGLGWAALGCLRIPAAWAEEAKNALWTPPQQAVMNYQMQGVAKGASISGTGVLNWEYLAKQKRYALSLEVSALMLSFLYQSKGRYQPQQGLQPDMFREKRLGKDRTVMFDYGAKLLHFNWKKGKDDSRDFDDGIQDVVSVMMQVAHLMANHPNKAKVGQKFVFPIARMGSVKHWEFSVLGNVGIHTPEGEIKAWHINRLRPKGDSDLQVEFWLSPALGYFPYQISFNRANGDYVKVVLSGVKKFAY